MMKNPLKLGHGMRTARPMSEDLTFFLDIPDPTIPDPLNTLPETTFMFPQAPKAIRNVDRHLRKILESVEGGALGTIEISDEFGEDDAVFTGTDPNHMYEVKEFDDTHEPENQFTRVLKHFDEQTAATPEKTEEINRGTRRTLR